MARLIEMLFQSAMAFSVAVSSLVNPDPIPPQDIEKIIENARSVFPNNTVEVHAFNVDWYNKLVAPEYKLDYKNDTIALSFFTIPYVFGNSFIPFLCKYQKDAIEDSWRKFIINYMKRVQQDLQETFKMKIPDEDIMYSFDMTPSNRAKILVQTAGHVAGAAYYYQRKDVSPDPWKEKQKIYGVSIHPLYGGYFSMDAVIILRFIHSPEMKQKQPPDVIPRKMVKELLTLYNFNWRDPKWRELVPVERKYTDEHMKYDLTYGKERETYVKYLIEKYCKHC